MMRDKPALLRCTGMIFDRLCYAFTSGRGHVGVVMHMLHFVI
jgi:hypothetical protein